MSVYAHRGFGVVALVLVLAGCSSRVHKPPPDVMVVARYGLFMGGTSQQQPTAVAAAAVAHRCEMWSLNPTSHGPGTYLELRLQVSPADQQTAINAILAAAPKSKPTVGPISAYDTPPTGVGPGKPFVTTC